MEALCTDEQYQCQWNIVEAAEGNGRQIWYSSIDGKLFISGTLSNNRPVDYVILEYTKTTDKATS